jgi:hypothetical protein
MQFEKFISIPFLRNMAIIYEKPWKNRIDCSLITLYFYPIIIISTSI